MKDLSTVAILSSGETVSFLAEWVPFILIFFHWLIFPSLAELTTKVAKG